jgi:hypothetical protein
MCQKDDRRRIPAPYYEALFKSKNSSHTGTRSETYDVGLYSHTQVDNSELRVSIHDFPRSGC